eukprot:TRINITY_DN25194_c0_g1_i1.p1 TRINITY_DN25194_c0_g1~~TRINITY_DN25194_c0_g1_i1.p1  ORF type:complete len:341 (+),score=39.31 TRINITY_DN25194_c0_g1_i1:27-1049(+)
MIAPWLFLFSIFGSLVKGGTFLGYSAFDCVNYGCKHVNIIALDSITGAVTNISTVPPNYLSDRVDLIHSVVDTLHKRYLLLYADSEPYRAAAPGPDAPLPGAPLRAAGESLPVVVAYDLVTTEYAITYLDQTLKGLFSSCYWPGPYLYGLGWLPGENPFTITAFRLTTTDYTIEAIADLPGSYLTFPECTFNANQNKLYYYSRNVGTYPRLLTIWEVDVYYAQVSRTWAVNGTLWHQAFLIQFDPIGDVFYGIVADGQLNSWLVSFDPISLGSDPFTKIAPISDHIFDSTPISYDLNAQEFVFVTLDAVIVRVSIKGEILRKPISGTPAHSIQKISYEKR